MPQLDQMVEADEGDLDSDQSDSEHNPTSEEDQQFSSGRDEERKSDSDFGSNSQMSDVEQGFLDDVFAQLGGFDVGDYGDEVDMDDDSNKKSNK